MKGFSTIELMVVVAIAGVLLTVIWARMSALVPNYRLEGAARDLAADLQKARGRAIAEGKCVRVTITTATNTYQIERAPTSTCTGFAAIPGEGSKKIDDANSLIVAFASGSSPVFDTRGSAPTIAAITLTNTVGAVRTVFVQQTGRVSVS